MTNNNNENSKQSEIDETRLFAEEQLKMEKKIESGASWFFWIAVLSIVNTVLILTGSEWSMIIGLGITQVVTAITIEIGSSANVIAFAVTLLVAGVFVFFGVFARKRHNWAFIIGMVFYALDSILFLLVGDWLSIGFHVFALYWIYGGLKTNIKYPRTQPV